MQCTDLLHSLIPSPSSSCSSLLNAQLSNHLQFEPRSRLSCCSKSYQVDANGENPAKNGALLPGHVKTITSTSNPFVKHCVKLRQSSSYRHSHTSVLLVGSIPIRELCRFVGNVYGYATIECLLVLDTAQVFEDLNNHYKRCIHVSPVVMKKLCGLQSTDSTDMAALIRIPSTFHNVDNLLEERDFNKWFPFHHRILVLDGIQDPGNLGTLLRSAIAFRWDGVFLLSDCCDPFNDKALRASRGASFQLPIVSGTWLHLDKMRRAFHMKILAGHLPKDGELKSVSWLSKDYADSVADNPLCLVLGSEGSGLSEISKQECELVSITMAGGFESLNVSVAGGIFLYMLQPRKS